MLVLPLDSANRDESQFPDADQFDVARHPIGAMAFGPGVHYCIGAPLAKMEIEIGMARLFTRFPDIRLAVPPEALEWKNNSLVRGLVALPVRLDPR